MKLIIESSPSIKGTIAEGIALFPGISSNGFLYERDTIKKASGLSTSLPVFWEHTGDPIGSVMFSLDESIPLIKYRLEITSPNHKIIEGKHRVSIDADANNITRKCSVENCYKWVEGLMLEGISITDSPSVIGSSLSIIESLQHWNKCDDCNKIKENEKIEQLENKILELQTKIEILEKPKCVNCGKVKKNG